MTVKRDDFKLLFARVLEAISKTAKEIASCDASSEMIEMVGRSRDHRDVEEAVRKIAAQFNGGSGKVLVSSVSALATAHLFDQAWDVVGHIDDFEHRAQAALEIARHTGDENHFADAEAVATYVVDETRRDEAIARIEQAKKMVMQSITQQQVSSNKLFGEVTDMISRGEFGGAFERILREPSAYARFRSLSAIGKHLANHF